MPAFSSLARRLAVPLLAALAVAAPVSAQPGAAADTISVNTSLSYSGRTDLDRDGQPLGDVAITAFQFGADSSVVLGERIRFGYGLDYAHFGLDRDAITPLPSELQSLSLPLSFATPFASGWMGRIMLRPGLYSRNLELSSDTFNVPIVALASYRASPTLSWTVGLRYDAWSEYPLLPLAGVNWQFAPDWELSVGLPRTGVSWQFHPDAALRLGATFQGGSFYVRDDPRPAGSTQPFVGHTQLDYREIRVGAALDLFSRGPASLTLDAGVIVSQRFDYDRADVRIDGDSAAYVSLAARFRF